MADLKSNFEVSGNLTLSGIIPDIQLSSTKDNVLVKKDDGYYVPKADSVSATDLSSIKSSVDTAVSMATSAQAASFTLDSIADLKAFEPTSSIKVVHVMSYTKGTYVGSGDFYYDSADRSTASDNATVIVTPKGARWKKIIENQNDINVTHFGAIPDGKTDCTSACLAMHNWSKKYNPKIGIQFPAGTFKLNGLDISGSSVSTFRMVGAMVSYGYFPATTLVSDQGTGMMVKVKARWSEFGNFFVNCENDLKEYGNKLNTKGFFQNIEIEGEYVRASNLRFSNMGGVCISLVDTLDTKIDQFYASKCHGGVIHATWSDSDYRGWNHSTAVELTNFNIQGCIGTTPIFDLQRCTQSIIRNGWIEHSTTPGDLSNGQWVIEAFSMEDCDTPLNLTFCRYIMTQRNFQGKSNIITNDSTKSTWLSVWEDGNTEIENHGIKTTGSMNYGYLTSENRFFNIQANSGWVKVGDLFVPADGDTVNLRIIGTSGFNSVGIEHKVGGTGYGGGEAIIRAQKKKSGVQLTWETVGASAVQDVMYFKGDSTTNCAVYVKLAPWTMNCVSIVETSAKDRYNAGICFRWMPAGTAITDTDFNALTGLIQAPAQLCLGAGKNGIVIGSDGYIGLSTVQITNNELPIYVNGTLYKITLTK